MFTAVISNTVVVISTIITIYKPTISASKVVFTVLTLFDRQNMETSSPAILDLFTNALAYQRAPHLPFLRVHAHSRSFSRVVAGAVCFVTPVSTVRHHVTS